MSSVLIDLMNDVPEVRLSDYEFEGTVVDIMDGDSLGRIKVRVPELHGTPQDIPDEHLPWCAMARPTMFGGMPNAGVFAVPRVGSIVTITHPHSNVYAPVYSGAMYTGASQIAQANSDYPDSYVFIDPEGNYYHVNMSQGKLQILFNGDRIATITGDSFDDIGGDHDTLVAGNQGNAVEGTLTEEVDGDVTETYNANHTTTTTGVSAETVTGNKTITAPVINLIGNVAVVGNMTITGTLQSGGLATFAGGLAMPLGVSGSVLGDIDFQGTVTINGIEWTQHGHEYDNNGSTDTTDGPVAIP